MSTNDPTQNKANETSTFNTVVAPEVATMPKTEVVAVPPGFVPKPLGRMRRKLRFAELREAPLLADELTDAEQGVADFGPHAPEAASIGAAVGKAERWSREAATARASHQFASEMADRAWERVFDILADFKPAFEYALAHSPTLASRYPATVSFFAVGTDVARRARKTARKNKATDEAAAAPVVEAASHEEQP